MTDIMRWDPFQEMTSLRDAMNQLLAESFVRPRNWIRAGGMPLDLYETENEYVVQLAAPGLKSDNFEITAQQDVLTISGRVQQQQPEGARFHIQELRFGDFARTLRFPSPVDVDNIQASLADGILTVRVPKSEAARPKRIAIKAA